MNDNNGGAYVSENSANLWACDECGCTDIQCTAWVEMNSGEVISDDGPSDAIWCPQCGTETGIADDKVSTPKPYYGDAEFVACSMAVPQPGTPLEEIVAAVRIHMAGQPYVFADEVANLLWSWSQEPQEKNDDE